ncbi:histone H2B type 1-P-like [Meriones unguiculatus]|uniref:histone H2B type 1-P-like n=1 Tax=Meriones unguiculatus TaxID=10047 RepID=UPI000B4EA353|nr:histone H2B type 1-P-like [Meriones unguiculatus]
MPEKVKSTLDPKKGSQKAVSKVQKKDDKKHKQSYSLYMCKVLGQMHSNMDILSKVMGMVNSFGSHILESIKVEASCLEHYNRCSTIMSQETQMALCLLLPLGN